MTKKQTDANDLTLNEIKSFTFQSPQNRIPIPDKDIIFDDPLVQFADGDDPIFNEYKTIIGATHLTPREALAQAYSKTPREMPQHLSVISWILPITGATCKSNRSQTHVPSRLWSHTRWYGEIFNDTLRKHVVELLTGKGYLVAAPALPSSLKIYNNEKGMYSNWSERHIAYAAGLGTFSLSDGFITERGIAHRCGSVVTSLELPASPRTAQGPYSNCLFYVNEKCGICIERCPAGAITEEGHDKIKCGQHLRDIGYSPDRLKSGYDIEKSVSGCGLCQTKVPCEAVNPTRKLKK
jgi:epoxyqueuosine reductase QueG